MIVFKNIKLLALTNMLAPVKGAAMNSFYGIENAWLCIEGQCIHSFGKMSDFDTTRFAQATTVDVRDRYVLPCYCDSHTHIVYAAPREQEFEYRIGGLTYEEIAAKGGGILNSAKVLQTVSEDELYNGAYIRLQQMIKNGTGAVEIKSGYGLTVESEIKMLRVIKRLRHNTNVLVKANFLAAHAMPTAFKNDRQGYINEIIYEMLPTIQREGLADFIDVFCDRGFYTVSEMEQILQAGIDAGLQPKIHANQLANIGAIPVAVKYGAASVDHCEHIGNEEIDSLLNGETIATLLPSAAFFLGLHYQPARTMIDAGLAIALASDCNPGSSPSSNMSFITSLACIKLKMTPAEALVAATINSAYAMRAHNQVGSIDVGKLANFIVTKPISSLAYIPYSFTESCIDDVYLTGKKT